jgi:hypothetical protein
VRFLLVPLGGALLVTPFIHGADGVQTVASVACGLALIALSLYRGRLQERYGSWDRFLGGSRARSAEEARTASFGGAG